MAIPQENHLYYLVRNHEAAEEIPQHVEWGRNNGGDIVIWRDGSGHHSVECEVQHGKIHEEYVPNKFQKCPLERSHGVENRAVNHALYKNVRELNSNLHKKGDI